MPEKARKNFLEAQSLFEKRFPGMRVEYYDYFEDCHEEDDDPPLIMYSASIEAGNGSYYWLYGDLTSYRWLFEFYRDCMGHDYHSVDEPTANALYAMCCAPNAGMEANKKSKPPLLVF